MPQFTEPPGLAGFENAMAARQLADDRVRRLRQSLGYLVSPEQERYLSEIEAALARMKTYLIDARAEVSPTKQRPT